MSVFMKTWLVSLCIILYKFPARIFNVFLTCREYTYSHLHSKTFNNTNSYMYVHKLALIHVFAPYDPVMFWLIIYNDISFLSL